jgi:hypothetical protein
MQAVLNALGQGGVCAVFVIPKANATAHLHIELVEAHETPAVVVITWPGKATVLHPRVFPEVAAQIARAFAQAATELASIRARRRL